MELDFTAPALRKLPTPSAKRTAYYDSETSGLGLFVHPTGKKTFFWFRRLAGKPVRKTIGEFPAVSVENARIEAAKFNTENEKWKSWKKSGYEGPNPIKRAQTGSLTLGEIFKAYYNGYRKQTAKSQERLPEEQRRFDRYLKPFADRRMDSLQRDELVDLHNEISLKNGRITANRTIELGKRMVNWAIRPKGSKKGGGGLWSGENPFQFVEFNPEKPKDRFAQKDELQRLFKALRHERSRTVRDFVLLALYTGQRRGNIAAMRWDEISVTADNQRLWRIPDPKNREPQVVPLMPQAAAVLAQRMKHRGDSPSETADITRRKQNGKNFDNQQNSAFVFPSTGKLGHIRDIKKGWKRLKKAAEIHDLTIHDLRRTLGSWMAQSNVSLLIIGKALGHRSTEATQIYARLQTDAARDGMSLAVGKFPKLPRLALRA